MYPEDDHKRGYEAPAMQAALRLFLPHRAEAPEEDDGDPAGDALPPETLRLLHQAVEGPRPPETHPWHPKHWKHHR